MDSGHSYYILDAQFDYFGKRFATCSSDHSICIWDQQQSQQATQGDDDGGVSVVANGGRGLVEAVGGEGGMAMGGWYPSARILKASRSAVLKISWSYPEFGTLIAACSEDGSVTIWEEQVDVGNPDTLNGPQPSTTTDDNPASSAAAPITDPSGDSTITSSQPPDHHQQQQQGPPAKWICRATLRESPRAVKDVEFAPRHLGLRLAAAGADGVVRCYEAVDVMNLSHWPLQDAFEAERPPGGVGAGGGNVALSLSWNKSRFDPPSMVVGGNVVKVWQYDDAARKWEVACVLSPSPRAGSEGGIGGSIAGATATATSGGTTAASASSGAGAAAAVHDVSWAPKMGRSYHAIATAGRDGRVRVYYLRYSERGQLTHAGPEDTREIDAQGEAWRVEWNVLGTVLASSGDDGVVKLWRKKRGRGENGGGEEWALAKAVSEPGREGDGIILLDN